MISSGADIIFTAAGGVNSGVYEACTESSKKAIGVDMACNYISPDTIITSALKNVGVGVKLTIKDVIDGNFQGGIAKIYDLSNGGVGYEDTTHLTDEIRAFVDEKISGNAISTMEE
jgi:basic membrane protein A